VTERGCTIVISPLVALMEDQVQTMRDRLGTSGRVHPVSALNRYVSEAKRSEIIEDLLKGHPETRLLYISPELFVHQKFRKSAGCNGSSQRTCTGCS
jgi:superfamily II DNA helicase RecQ